MVCHNYPPAHTAGTETYAAELARRLAARGHELGVFAAEKDISLPDLAVRERAHEGVPVTEVVNNLFHLDFRSTWDQPRIAELFGAALDRFQPEVVHFQHLMYLSIGCVEEAARRGLGIVFTLHDYWLQCPRLGQRVHADGGLCERIDFARCGTCLARTKLAQTPFERRAGRAIAALRGTTGLDLGPLARRVARSVSGGDAAPRPEDTARCELEARERDRAMRERVVPLVGRFLSPSRFLLEQFVAWGVPRGRIEHLPTGIALESFARVPRAPREVAAPGAKLRVGFLGSLVALKGPALLLEAWARLDRGLAERAELVLYGPGEHEPAFQEELARRAARVGARLAGRLPHAQVPAVLAELDLLVVPSLWYENAPLVILEARAAGTPVLVADAGGMAELVREGGGRCFRLGDAGDLARVLGELLSEPAVLAELRGGPPPPAAGADVARLEALYAEVLAEVRGPAPLGSRP
jgi:glycosyltransferase involved in cell wall biosynthesis